MSAETGRISADTIRSARIREAATTAPAPEDTDPKEWGFPVSVRPSSPLSQIQKCFYACVKLCVALGSLATWSACQENGLRCFTLASRLLAACTPVPSPSALPLLLTYESAADRKSI